MRRSRVTENGCNEILKTTYVYNYIYKSFKLFEYINTLNYITVDIYNKEYYRARMKKHFLFKVLTDLDGIKRMAHDNTRNTLNKKTQIL